MEDGSYRPISRIASSVVAILSHLHVPVIDFIDLYTSESTLRLTQIQWWFWLSVKFELYQWAEWSSLLLTNFLEFYNYIVKQWHVSIFHLSTQMNAEW